MQEWLDNVLKYASDVWVQATIVVFFTLLAAYIQRLVFKRLHARLLVTRNPWDDALIEALHRPVTWLIWVVGIGFAAEIVASSTDAVIYQSLDPTRALGVIFIISWFLIRLIQNAEKAIYDPNVDTGEALDHTTWGALSKVLRGTVFVVATLMAMQTLGYSISGVLAFGGIGGLAVGFAAKDLLSNFFGGLMIYLDRPFKVGEWIRSPDKEIEGTVEKIGWRLTCIRTFDQRPLYVPNSVFTTIVLQNPSRMTNRRIYETIGIRYADADKMSHITEQVEQLLRAHPEIDTEKTLMVHFNAFAASSLDFFVYTFTKTTEWVKFHRIKHEILLSINRIISEQGAEIAFPTSTVHLFRESEDPVSQGDSHPAAG